jgi:hypothetical protein
MALPINNTTVPIRGLLFSVQLIAFLWMAIIIAIAANGSGP